MGGFMGNCQFYIIGGSAAIFSCKPEPTQIVFGKSRTPSRARKRQTTTNRAPLYLSTVACNHKMTFRVMADISHLPSQFCTGS